MLARPKFRDKSGPMTRRSSLRGGRTLSRRLTRSLLAAAVALRALPSNAEELDPEAAQRPAERAAQKGSEARQITLDFSASLGPSVRLGSAPSLVITDRTGLLAGGGVALAPSRTFSIDLEYEHLNLGAERLAGSGVQSAAVERDAHAAWADLRVYLRRSEALSIFAGVGLGLAWQRAHASLVIEALESGGAARSVELVLCDASAPASVGLRANVGVEVPIGGPWMLVGAASLENARLSGELLDRCVSGAGATSLFAARAGLAYRLDVSSLFL